jgi:hypothetical protein
MTLIYDKLDWDLYLKRGASPMFMMLIDKSLLTGKWDGKMYICYFTIIKIKYKLIEDVDSV